MSSNKKLEDFILHKNIFSKKLADRILKEYKEELFDRDSHHNKETRFLGSLEISNRSITNSKNSYVRAKIIEEIQDQINSVVIEYNRHINVKGLPIEESSPFSLRQMKEGDWYGEHDDDGVGKYTGSYKFTISICLNEEYEGGEFTFFEDSLIYPLKKGDVIMFPSSFMFPHSVKKIIKGTRYQLILWLR